MDIPEKTCGTCEYCMKSVRNDGTGFCFSDKKVTDCHMPLKKEACRFYKFKIEEKEELNGDESDGTYPGNGECGGGISGDIEDLF